MVPQNRVRPRRQQIVYYWRNDTNTLLNLVQSHKTQCFTLILGVSLKSALSHSHSCIIFLSLFISLSRHSFNNEGSLLFIGSHSNNDWRLAVGGCHNYMIGSWRLT
jgi:hypothetical protein